MRSITGKTAERRLVGLAEAAEYASCSTHTLRRRISEGSLRAYRMPGKSRLIRIDLDELDAALRPIRSSRRDIA